MNLFRQRIKRLRVEKGLSQKELALELGVTEISVQRYEYGDRTPNLDQLIVIADFFRVSLDYLAGRSDGRQEER